MGVNSVTLVGRAGRDPEVRYFESGSVVANLTMAVNRIRKRFVLLLKKILLTAFVVTPLLTKDS